MKKIIGLLFFLFVLALPIAVSASNDGNSPKVYVLDNFNSQNRTEGDYLFLFSNAAISEQHSGNIYSVGGKTSLAAEVFGEVYIILGECVVGKDFAGNVNFLFSKVLYTPSDKAVIKPIVELPSFLTREFTQDSLKGIDTTVPGFLLGLILSLFEFCVCVIIFWIKRGFMEQGAEALRHEPLRTATNGLMGYFMILVMIVMLGMTIFLLPMAIFVFLILYATVLVGQVSLSILIGIAAVRYYNTKKWDKKLFSSFGLMILGLIILGIIKNIPYVSWIVAVFFLPVLAVGIVITAIYNGFVKKSYYYTDQNEKKLDNTVIRNIIINGKNL